jgi:hypothetical protein
MRLPPFKDDGETKNAAIMWQICRLACFFSIIRNATGVWGGGRAGVCSAYSGLKYSTPIGWGRRVANLGGKNSAMQREKWGTVLALYMRQQWERLRMQGGGFVEEKTVSFQHKICRGQLAKLGCTHLK